MNSSQAIEILQKEYPILQYPMWIVLGLIIIALIILIIAQIAQRSGDDLYNWAKKKVKRAEIGEVTVVPSPTTPQEHTTRCMQSISLPQRNPNFTGREDILPHLRGALTSGEIGMCKQALTGLGGKGKSQIAVEYAYLHQRDYQFIWWLGSSEETAALAANYAGLASELNLPEKGSADQNTIIAAVKRWLGENRNWLLIFDNVKVPEDIEHYLPSEGKGHVIITSRNPNWGGVAGEIPIRVFKRKESVEFLGRRTKQKNEEEASLLADVLGDLPLALEQAGAYIEETAISHSDYLKLFLEHRQKILERGKPVGYPDTIATTWDISFLAVQKESADAIDLLKLLAFMAPDNIPRSILIEGASELPEPLSSAIKDGIKLNDSMAALRRYSLISITDDLLSVHRLVQAVMLDTLADDEKKKWAEAAIRMVNKAFPFDSDDVSNWSMCSLLLPHALAAAKFAEELDVAQEATGRLLNQIGGYLRERAEFIEAKKNFERALVIQEKAFGPDHNTVAICLNNLGLVLKDLGDPQGAKKNFERALVIQEKAFGPDHNTVAIDLNNLGSVLYDLDDLQGAKMNLERALKIDETVYGTDHPNVARDVNNLGGILKDLGDLQGPRSVSSDH